MSAAPGFLVGAPSLALFTAAAVSLAVAVASVRRTSSHGGMAFSVMMFAVFCWAISSGLGAGAVSLAGRTVFLAGSFIAAANVAPLFLLFALRYRRRDRRPTAWAALLWLIPAFIMALAVTNRGHLLLWTVAPGASPRFVFGPAYYVAVSYYAVLGLVAAVLIVRAAFHAPRMFVGQTVILLSGLVVPWLATALNLMPFNPFVGVDLPPAAFAITGILLFIGMGRFGLLDLVPVARHLVVERMTDGLLVLDAKERVVDVNPAALVLFGVSALPAGSRADGLGGELGRALGTLLGRPAGHAEVTLPGAAGGRSLDLHSSQLRDRRGRVNGRLIVVQDVTARRQMELDRERLIGELRAALADVKTLSGLVPICSSCKRIRDDTGYWRTLERYLAEHSDAQFTHGLCDDCVRRLYPDLAPEEDGPGTSE